MQRTDVVNKLFITAIEEWNEDEYSEKLNPELSDIFRRYLDYAYVTGFDNLAIYLIKMLEGLKGKYPNGKSITTISINSVIEEIKYYKDEVHSDDTRNS